jgi:propanol-preferring alcohol dehydrogenase
VGGGHPHITVNFGDVLGKDLTLRANSVYSVRHYFEAVAFLGRHPVPLDDIVTHRYKIEQAVEAFSTFDQGETGKVIFEWEN